MGAQHTEKYGASPYSAGIDFRRQNLTSKSMDLTSVDVRFKSIPRTERVKYL